MRLYLIAVVMAVAATTFIIRASMFHASPTRVVPVNLYQLK